MVVPNVPLGFWMIRMGIPTMLPNGSIEAQCAQLEVRRGFLPLD